jgi:hypothetical protein
LWEEKCRESDVFDDSTVHLEEGQNWTVCSRHFLRADYMTINDIHILGPNAVPSTFRCIWFSVILYRNIYFMGNKNNFKIFTAGGKEKFLSIHSKVLLMNQINSMPLDLLISNPKITTGVLIQVNTYGNVDLI